MITAAAVVGTILLVLVLCGVALYLARSRDRVDRESRSSGERAEQLLDLANQRYDQLVQRIPVGVYTLLMHPDGSFEFEHCSRPFLQMLGLTDDDVRNDPQTVHAIFHPTDHPPWHPVDSAAGDQEPFRWEGPCQVRGETRWLHIEAEPTVLADGDSRWNGVLLDITDRKCAEEELLQTAKGYQRISERLELAARTAHFGVWEWEVHRDTAIWDDTMFEIYGLPSTIPMPVELWHQTLHPEDAQAVLASVRKVRDTGSSDAVRFRIIRPDGTVRTIAAEQSPMLDKSGKVSRIVGINLDITEQAQATDALHEVEQRYRFITENVGDVVWTLDPQTFRFTYVSPSVLQLRGFTPEEVMAAPLDAALSPEDTRRLQALIAARVEHLESGAAPPPIFQPQEVAQPRKDGSLVWTEALSVLRRNERTGAFEVLGVSRDISARKAAEDDLKRLSSLDALTGILNQRAFLQTATERLDSLDGSCAALIFIDLDNMKAINDDYGHASGDQALITFADALRAAFRKSDLVGRLGGDEFGVLAVAREAVSDDVLLARFREELARVNNSGDASYLIEASAGVAWIDPSSEQVQLPDLMRLADARMYRSKRAKKVST